jgi:branched-chain amino acid transport system ATP-binding protein
MSEAQSFLSVRELTVAYGSHPVLSAIDLDVYRGEVVALIGANGAGKTTLLRTLSGLLAPRAGHITFDGRNITAHAPHDIVYQGLIHVPEGRQVFVHLSVDDNLAMGAYRPAARADYKARYDQVLSRFPRLIERKAQLAGLLSGGEQQMLALARALMADPTVLMLDEPSMGLAPLFVDEIFDLLAALKKEGRTILLVEQNASAALALADRAYVLEHGRIVLQGRAADVMNDKSIMSAYLGEHFS